MDIASRTCGFSQHRPDWRARLFKIVKLLERDERVKCEQLMTNVLVWDYEAAADERSHRRRTPDEGAAGTELASS